MLGKNSTPSLLKFVCCLVLCAYALLEHQSVLAAEHFVPSEVSDINCGVFGGGIRAGDRVVLESGTRDPLKIQNCKGSAERPIVVTNDPSGDGPTIIRRRSSNSKGFVFSCNDCEHFVLDGTFGWLNSPAGTTCGSLGGENSCGIQVTSTAQGDAPSAYIAFIGSSSNFTIRGVEVNGRWPSISTDGIGISVNDQNFNLSDNPGKWRENILIENNYVHDVEGECLYVGPNWEFEGNVDDLKLRDIEIASNLITDCGWDGIQLKSAIAGVNRIHHNTVVRTGKARDDNASQHIGISLYESGNGFIHNNWIEDAGEHGIQHFLHRIPPSYGELQSSIYNNVIIAPGQTGPQPGKGITVSRNDRAAQPRTTIFNNTIIGPEDSGILIGGSVSVGGVIRNNIIADAGGAAISAPDNVVTSANRTGSAASMNFMNASALNFRLREDSGAVDTGSSIIYPEDDFDGTRRPQGTQPDIGAYEFASGLDSVRPNPPQLVAEP